MCAGLQLVTNQARPILTILEDSCGRHDTLMSGTAMAWSLRIGLHVAASPTHASAACNKYRYEAYGCREYHRSCCDNMHEGLAELGVKVPFTEVRDLVHVISSAA